MSSLLSVLNKITSSILFKNSGAKAFLSEPSIILLEYSSILFLRADVLNPTPEPNYLSLRVPILEVIMMIVFLKSILRPKLSVN